MYIPVASSNAIDAKKMWLLLLCNVDNISRGESVAFPPLVRGGFCSQVRYVLLAEALRPHSVLRSLDRELSNEGGCTENYVCEGDRWTNKQQ